jgi:hypothetical protein
MDKNKELKISWKLKPVKLLDLRMLLRSMKKEKIFAIAGGVPSSKKIR